MPTMNDVAKLAGVSRGTVSNYINGVAVKIDSQKKIKSAIEQLNYIPNITARELKSNRSNFIVFILPTTHTPFFAELTKEIQQELKEKKYKMILCLSNNQIQEELEYIQMAKEQKVAGIITISYSDLGSFLTDELPIVSLEKELKQTIPCISSDQYQGGWLAAKTLVEKGSRSLLLVTRTTEKTKHNYGKRAKGFIDYCEKYQVPYQMVAVDGHETYFYQKMTTFVQQNFQDKNLFDGIFTVSDQYADFLYNLFIRLNYRIPEELQIIGFDGGKMYPEQKYSLSSIRQPVKAIAQEGIRALESVINKEGMSKDDHLKQLPVTFMQGISTRK